MVLIMKKICYRLKQKFRDIRGAFLHPGLRTLYNKRVSGFTLVELLVVIAIIALLMGILIPALNRTRKQAKKIACLSNMRQIGIATQAYLIDSQYSLPPSSCHITDPNGNWLRILSQYTQEAILFCCPADQEKKLVDWDKPLSEQTDKRLSSFAVNALLDPTQYRYSGSINRYNNVNNIKHPADCIWISEAPDREQFYLADHIHPEQWEGAIEYAKRFVDTERHMDTSNYLFAEGHAENLKFEQTYNWPNKCCWYPETAPKWPENP